MPPQNILITGANRGVGIEIVKQILKLRPKHLIATCRKPDDAKELRGLVETNPCLHVIKLDVSDENSIRDASKQADEIVGADGLNVLINNAAIYLKCSSVKDISVDEMVQSYRTNVVGPAIMCREFLPLLQRAQAITDDLPISWETAAIVNISTNLGAVEEQDYADHYHYDPTKAALNMFTRTLHVELKSSGILVVAIHPGWVRTDMGGSKAPVMPEDSANGIANVLQSLTVTDSGKLYSFTGRKMPW